MSTFSIFLVLITIVCFLLIIVVMVQNPKGGGLSSSLGGSTQMGGVQKTTDFLDKSTWTLGGILIALILLSSLSFNGAASGSKVLGEDETSVPTTTIPTTPEAAKQAAPAATPAPVATDSTK